MDANRKHHYIRMILLHVLKPSIYIYIYIHTHTHTHTHNHVSQRCTLMSFQTALSHWVPNLKSGSSSVCRSYAGTRMPPSSPDSRSCRLGSLGIGTLLLCCINPDPEAPGHSSDPSTYSGGGFGTLRRGFPAPFAAPLCVLLPTTTREHSSAWPSFRPLVQT